MVFFTCNACGSSLKKNQVEKHYQNECRNCSVLSCMDCGQDFYGDDYVGHTKCVSEAEKYQGAMFKGNSNKGDKKQQEWLQRAHSVIQGAKVGPRISVLLEKMLDYPNIPRKKAKFENFIRNSLNVRDQSTLNKLWSIFNQDPQPSSSGAADGTAGVEAKPSPAATELIERKEDCEMDQESSEEKDESNWEGKKDEKKGVCEDDGEVKKKSKKKRKRDVEGDHESRGSHLTKKRPKRDKDQMDAVEMEHDMVDEDLKAEVVKPKKKKKSKKSAKLELNDNDGEAVTEIDNGILIRGEMSTTVCPAGGDSSGGMENQQIERKKKKKKKKKEKDLSMVVDNCEPAAIEQTKCVVAVEDAEDGMENGTGLERVHKKKRRKHLATLVNNEGGSEVMRLRADTGKLECVEKKARKSRKLAAKEAVDCNGHFQGVSKERSSCEVP